MQLAHIYPKELYAHFKRDSLFQNSIYLILATAVMSLFGFVFWIFGAKLFTTEQIGLTSSLLSVTGIVSSLSFLGFNNSIIRYLPGAKSPNTVFRNAVTLTTITSCVISIVSLFFLHFFTPALAFVAHSIFLASLFVLFTFLNTLNFVFENTFIALRAAKRIFIKNIFFSLIKLIAPFFLVSFAAFGLYSAIGLSTAFGCLYAIYYLAKSGLTLGYSIDPNVIQPMFTFSAGNYVVSVLNSFPGLLLPILITSGLGATASGYYYIDYLIIGLLFVIPSATSNAFLAEGSQQDAKLLPIVISTIKITYGLLIPGILAIFLFGPFVLEILGKNYASEGILLLRILALSGIFVAFNYLCNSLLNLHHKIGGLVIVNFFGVVFVLTSVLYSIRFGLVGVGWGWLVGQALVSVIYALFCLPLVLPTISKTFRNN